MFPESDQASETRTAVGTACLERREHRCTWVSATLARYLGRSPEDCIGQPLGVLAPELFVLCEPHCRKVSAEGIGVDGVKIVWSPQGGAGAAEFAASFYPILEPSGAVAQIGMAIAELNGLSRLEEKLHAEASRGELLAGFSMDLQEGASSLAVIIETVVAEVCTLIGDVAILNLLSEDGEWFDAVGIHARRPAIAFALRKSIGASRQKAGEGLSGMVVATGKSRLIPSVDPACFRQEFHPKQREWLEELKPTSIVVVPLRARGRVLGCLILARNESEQPYTEQDRVFLQDLADRAALGLDNARLHERVTRDARRATTLAALGWALSQAQTSHETLLETLVEMVASEMRDLCMVTLLSEDGRRGAVYAVYHEDEQIRQDIKDRLVALAHLESEGLTTVAARRDRTLFVAHLNKETAEREGIARHLAEFEGTGWRPHSLISVVLHARERVIGTLTIARDASPEPYGLEDRFLAESVAEWVAFKIENARLHQSLQETIETLEVKAQELAAANRRLRDEFDQRSRMGAALVSSEARLRAVLDTAVDAIITVERGGSVQSFNRGAEALFGYRPDEVIGRDVTVLMPKTYWIEESELDKMIGPGREAVARRKDGSTFPAEVSVSRVDLAEGEVLYTVILRDITERKRAAEDAHRAAFEDPLTGLANRRLLLDHLEQAVLRSERTGQCTGVLYLDLDRFSVTNDALGHGMGDQVLRLVGNRLRMGMRPQDTVARIGSDEFVILLDDLEDSKQAEETGQRFLELLRVPLLVAGQELFLSASIGIAVKSAGNDSAQDLIRFAEIALRRAKEKGRGRCVLFDEAERAALMRELPQEYDLHRALDQGEFEIRFQPIVDLKTMKIIALEALLRWNWRGQILAPAAFIAMAEESGMIVPIGEWVLRTAARSVREWDKEHGARLPLRVHVNVSARQLNDTAFPDRIRQILTETGFSAARLSLELTETTLIEDPDRARTQLTRIADLGVKLAIDDFGTGYSSLTYLMAYPVHEVKIDKSFVQDLNVHAARATLVESIIHLTHRLGMKVIAEGVETEDQLRPLMSYGCDLAQGYLFGRPVPTDAIRAQLRQIFPLGCRVS